MARVLIGSQGGQAGGQTKTTDGVHVHLDANVACLRDVASAVAGGADSVGLMRTESLYVARTTLPSEEEQYVDAVAVMEALGGRTVTIRTLNLAADELPIGGRSPPLSAARRDIFRTQVRALYRAAAAGPLRIMFPLISGVSDLTDVRTVCDEICADLARAGTPHQPSTPVGVMIETPSAALTVDHLARQCDFFSIGANDLIRTTFAADRHDQGRRKLYQPLHPAVLRSLSRILIDARAASRPVSICGDIVGEPAFVWIMLGLGFRELSMEPRHLAKVRALISASSLAEAEKLTARALQLGSELEVERLVLGAMGDRFGPEIEGSAPADPAL